MYLEERTRETFVLKQIHLYGKLDTTLSSVLFVMIFYAAIFQNIHVINIKACALKYTSPGYSNII